MQEKYQIFYFLIFKLLVQMGKNVSEYSPVLLLFAQFISKKYAL